jgi:hypothetical protein
VLSARGVSFVKSHALGYLIGLVEENGIKGPGALSEADVLSPWAVEFRYEGEGPPALDRLAALTLVAELRTWAEREIEAAERPSKSEESEEEHEPERERRP